MIYRFARTYIVVGTILIIFIFSVQLLRFQSISASTLRRPSAPSTWTNWIWPAYETVVPTAGNYDDGEIGFHKGSETKTEDRWSDEVTTLPPSATHTLPMPASSADSNPRPESNGGSKQDLEQTAPTYPDTAWRNKPLPALNTTFHVPDDIYFDPNGPRPDQVVFVTAADGKGHNGGIENILEKTAENRKQYCDHHGYNYHFVNISQFDLGDAHPVWKKLPAIVDAFNTYPDAQWIFFLDLDAIIMTPKQDLNSLVLSHDAMRKALSLNTEFHEGERTPLGLWTPAEPDIDNLDLLIAQDHNGINAGSFFLRRSKFTQWLLDMWADPFFMGMYWPAQEQETLLHFVKHHHTFRQHTGLLKQRIANAFSEGDESMRWVEGDLLVHLAGCWVEHQCQERWNDLWNRRGSI